MRILFHIAYLGVGGAERQLTYLVRGLAERGWEIHVVTLYHGGRFWQELERVNGCKLHSLDRQNRWDFSVIPKLVRYVKANKIELVHGWMLPCNSFAALAAKLVQKPALMAIRASNMNYRFGSRMYVRADKLVAQKMVKRVIFNSYAGRDHNVLQGYPEEKCIVIPNGLACPNDIIFPEPFCHEPPWKIGMIARLDPMKDHVTMFKALAILLQKKVPVELHLYGDGEYGWKQYLKSETQRLCIDTAVYWHGFVDDVWSVLSQLDIVASSSSYGEGMSNTLLEAMMAGRVIVATDVGDAKRMLDSEVGRCGAIVPVKDGNAMAKEILDLIQKPFDAVLAGRRARETAMANFSVNAMVEQYVKVFSCLV